MEIRLPQLGEGADSGSVANIFVKEGDTIQPDDPVIELESDKAVASIPSPSGGVVSKIHIKQGDTVKVGQLLITLDSATAAEAPPPQPAEPKTAPAARTPAPVAAPLPAQSQHPPAAAPSVRRLARRLGIDLRGVPGTERGGRISIGDVRAYIDQLHQTASQQPPATAGPAPTAAPAIDFAQWGEITRQPMTPLRQTIARRMQESWTTIPHVTQFHEADITDLEALRKKLAPEYQTRGARLTLTPLILKALVTVLKNHPLLNASLDERTNELVFKQYYHLGIAVDTDHGLIVPVLRDVDRKNLLTLSNELEELAAKAKQRKVTGEDLKGGTFTISNQGGIGGGHFTPIVNRPEVAILGLGRGTMKAVVTADNQIVPRLILPLCVSYDHRVIDGANAARFTVDLATALEQFDPQLLEDPA